jgi:hypothetical protein
MLKTRAWRRGVQADDCLAMLHGSIVTLRHYYVAALLHCAILQHCGIAALQHCGTLLHR